MLFNTLAIFTLLMQLSVLRHGLHSKTIRMACTGHETMRRVFSAANNIIVIHIEDQ